MQSDALVVELRHDTQPAAERFDVGLECSHFGVGERAVLDLADPRLADLHPLRQRLLIECLRLADVGQSLSLHRIGEGPRRMRDARLVHQATADGVRSNVLPVPGHVRPPLLGRRPATARSVPRRRGCWCGTSPSSGPTCPRRPAGLPSARGRRRTRSSPLFVRSILVAVPSCCSFMLCRALPLTLSTTGCPSVGPSAASRSIAAVTSSTVVPSRPRNHSLTSSSSTTSHTRGPYNARVVCRVLRHSIWGGRALH